MSINLYDLSAVSFQRSLTSLLQFMDKAQALADAKKFDVNTLVEARLAPDMYPFAKQVQIACDSAKLTLSRVTGKEAPKYEDNEKTFDELRQRVTKTIAYLATFKKADFSDVEERQIKMPWTQELWMHAGEYVPQFALPNFYFHLAMAYAILRNNGADVGKIDFIGNINLQQSK